MENLEKFRLTHIYESQQFSREILDVVFNTADKMKRLVLSRGNADFLYGKIMASLFYEPSTRTRFSFESAIQRLGGSVLMTENAKVFSSVSKGETLRDTIRIMNGYCDVIVLRHNIEGSAKEAAAVSRVPVINAGDGAGQHPTQALLDMYTIREYFGKFEGLRIAMVGDLKYGRTVRSLSYLLSKFSGIKIYFVSPEVCRMSDDIKSHLDEHGMDWEEASDLISVLPSVDCVYMTRVQKERFADASIYEKAAGRYILDREKASMMKKKAIIMHPLPRVNEIPPEVDNDPRAKYFEQAINGLYIRMALLKLLLR